MGNPAMMVKVNLRCVDDSEKVEWVELDGPEDAARLPEIVEQCSRRSNQTTTRLISVGHGRRLILLTVAAWSEPPSLRRLDSSWRIAPAGGPSRVPSCRPDGRLP
jgi:hypothetical protein